MSRAAKVTVKIPDSLRKKFLKSGEMLVTDSFVNELGPKIITGMKELISKGSSPVKGFGRFAGYGSASKSSGRPTNSTRSKSNKPILKYPHTVMNKYPDKKVRPVNLSLTGTMLSFLSFRRNGSVLEVGLLPNAPDKVKVIGRVHNTGEREDIPKRQFIPNDGEEFTASIMVIINRFYKEKILSLFND